MEAGWRWAPYEAATVAPIELPLFCTLEFFLVFPWSFVRAFHTRVFVCDVKICVEHVMAGRNLAWCTP